MKLAYFCFDRETQQFWVSPNTNENDLTEIQYATVLFSDSFFKLSPIESGTFSLEKELEFIILNSNVIQPPCSFCNKNIIRIFSPENCKPCIFNLVEPYDMYDLPFEKKNLETSLIQKGFIRTTRKMFLKNIFLSKNF